MGPKPAKKASRGSRRPKKDKFVALRLTEETKTRWQSVADKLGVTLSELVELQMQAVLAGSPGDPEFGAPHVRALALLVARAGRMIERATGTAWRAHPYVAAALGACVRKITADLVVSGEKRPAPMLRTPGGPSSDWAQDDPRAFGEWVAGVLLEFLRSAATVARDPSRMSTTIAPRDPSGQIREGVWRIVVPDENRFWVQLASDLKVGGAHE